MPYLCTSSFTTHQVRLQNVLSIIFFKIWRSPGYRQAAQSKAHTRFSRPWAKGGGKNSFTAGSRLPRRAAAAPASSAQTFHPRGSGAGRSPLLTRVSPALVRLLKTPYSVFTYHSPKTVQFNPRQHSSSSRAEEVRSFEFQSETWISRDIKNILKLISRIDLFM